MPPSRKQRDVAGEPFETLNEDLIQMTRNILEVGPRLGELARRTKVHRETVRYRFRKYFVKRGFVVQANLNYQKLGLKRLTVVCRLAPTFEPHLVPIMSALNEMCYLTGFVQTTLEGLYIMQVVVPSELRDDCVRVYERLEAMGIFTDMQVLRFEEVRSVPMRPEYYDFSNGLWAYDWQREEITGSAFVPSGRAEAEKYDLTDLLILKELDRDASQSGAAIAKRLNIPYKTLRYHYCEHVVGRALLNGYRVLWQGTTFNAKSEKADSRRHTYICFVLLVLGTTDGQRTKLAANTNLVPFLWFEASDPNYYAELFVPIDSYNDFLKRVRELALATRTRPRVFTVDQTKALRFSIAYKLYDPVARRWQLDSHEVIARFKNLVLSVNNSGGGLDAT